METNTHVCPVWVGYLLTSPLRQLFENPQRILDPYIKKGMKILEIGPGMGYFSIPMARMTGKEGKVFCVDIQEKMLYQLRKRALRKGVADEIKTIPAKQNSFNTEHLSNQIDFTLLAYVVHEVPDQHILFSEVAKTMKQGARILMMEPKGHVDENHWDESLRIASKFGFSLIPTASNGRGRVIELIKK
jgi:ubiquinone/menaquinone biosynthesis C-methylase UbiE